MRELPFRSSTSAQVRQLRRAHLRGCRQIGEIFAGGSNPTTPPESDVMGLILNFVKHTALHTTRNSNKEMEDGKIE
jgi:hypothetical protein